MRDLIDLVEAMRFDESTPEVMERKERARKLGFDVTRVLYHGTGSGFAAFKRSTSGKNMGAGEREPFAVWLTSSAEVAGVYADASTRDVQHFITGEVLRKGDGAQHHAPLCPVGWFSGCRLHWVDALLSASAEGIDLA